MLRELVFEPRSGNHACSHPKACKRVKGAMSKVLVASYAYMHDSYKMIYDRLKSFWN